jgi:hypothetical protein
MAYFNTSFAMFLVHVRLQDVLNLTFEKCNFNLKLGLHGHVINVKH